MVKIERSFPAPQSLAIEAKKLSGSYEMPDVVERLKKDFHNKCYICELKNLQDPQVEHLLPHKSGKYPERKFNWENLFWSCSHCNGVKNQKKYDIGIIDCCKDDPETLLTFKLIEGKIKIYAKDENNSNAVRTALLIHETFNLMNTGMRTYASAMRYKELLKEMNILYDNLEEYKNNPDSTYVQRKLKALLRRESAFAAFKRDFVRSKSEEFPKLLEYIL